MSTAQRVQSGTSPSPNSWNVALIRQYVKTAMRCTVDVVNILNACAIVKSLLNYFLLRVRVTVPARLNEAACAGIPQVSPATGIW